MGYRTFPGRPAGEDHVDGKDICWGGPKFGAARCEPGLDAVSYYESAQYETYPIRRLNFCVRQRRRYGVYKVMRFYASTIADPINPIYLGPVQCGLDRAFAIAMGQEIR